MTDFDRVVDRRNTNCAKYDFNLEKGKPEDSLPVWVADMDFCAPKEVVDAVTRAASHGIYGYTDAKDAYYEAVCGWFSRRFHWDVKREWIIKTPGVVFAICTAIRALTNPGDAVLIQQPVYGPFANSIRTNNRRLVVNELVLDSGVYTIDFAALELQLAQENVKMFVLCSPHNPVGRVWTTEELTRIGELCLKHRVYLVCDEIHCDFTYPGVTHTVLASLDERFAQNTITCTAPSKTFNLAGLQASNIFIPNPEIREKFEAKVKSAGYGELNTMAVAACEAAYTCGEAWLEDLRVYLQGNLDTLRAFLKEHLPQIHLVEPQGTYLVWLDCRELGLDAAQLEDFMTNRAKLWFSEGAGFGIGGEGFERMNIACPRSTLLEALRRLEQAVHSR